ncbi:hypothetical protein Hanom_Chr03g00199111 [Helianthus anomalus]
MTKIPLYNFLLVLIGVIFNKHVFISHQMTHFNSDPFTNLLDPPILPLCTTNLEVKLKIEKTRKENYPSKSFTLLQDTQ